MAFDPRIADDVRMALSGVEGLTERCMFGGLAFLVDGNLAVAAAGHGGLMVRVDPAASQTLLDSPGVSRMVMRGRELAGWLLVDGGQPLDRWITVGVAYARSLPPK